MKGIVITSDLTALRLRTFEDEDEDEDEDEGKLACFTRGFLS